MPTSEDRRIETYTDEVRQLLARAAQLARVEHTEHVGEAETREKLNAHGLDDTEIKRQLGTLKLNTAENKTAAITTYSFLHGLQHLDVINGKSPSVNGSAGAILAIFRSAEICLYAIGTLSARMLTNLQEERISEALSNARWRSGFQQLLYKLSLLVVEMNAGGADGSVLNIHESEIFQDYETPTRRLEEWLTTSWREDEGDIFSQDIDVAKRFIFFHEFVNTSDERIWSSMFEQVQMPGVFKEPDEDDRTFYGRVVCSGDIEQMMTAMETEGDTDLLPFRAVHQVTEIVAAVTNTLACEAANRLLTSPTEEWGPALEGLILGNRLLTVADDSIKLMMRTLTPKGYSAVRPNLGMVLGASSVVLRKTLFNSTYPLLVRAFKLRIMDLSGSDADDNDAVVARSVNILRGDASEPLPAAILQQLVILHQHIRTWRDNHVQLPKTQLGVSEAADQPTVSLSGSDGAVGVAHDLRKAHAADPIVPLYRALMGVAPPALHEQLTPGGFDEHMARATSRAVFDVYEDVQERFYRRCPVRHTAD